MDGLETLRQWLQGHLDTCSGPCCAQCRPRRDGYACICPGPDGPAGYCGYELQHGVEMQDILDRIREIQLGE